MLAYVQRNRSLQTLFVIQFFKLHSGSLIVFSQGLHSCKLLLYVYKFSMFYIKRE